MSVSPETLASYVPTLVARRFAVNPAPLTEPLGERFPAAVLFADISGYSTMAARLAQQGPSGAEELIRLLNAYFGQMIDVVSKHGGDIVKFAGDAALILWPATDESLSTVTHRATQCGLDMQTILGQYQVTEGLRLSLRVGIGAGEVLTASVGGLFGRWEFLVAGAPLAQMSAAQRQAKPGQVVLSPEAWALVQARYVGFPLYLPPEAGGASQAALNPNQETFVLVGAVRDALRLRPLTRVIPAPGSEMALRGYIPRSILARLDAGQTEWLAELRRLTVVFINITGLDFSAPDALEQAQAVMHTVQKALYHYEGSVNQFLVDDKGTTLVAAYGLPPLAHEDDAARGVQAAIAAQTGLRDLGLHCAIGVTTERAFCGERGNAVRREYAMVGDVVNMSARLMQAASKYKGSTMTILCDEATHNVARARLAFDALSPIQVKGRSEPMPIFRPRGLVSKSDAVRLPAYPQTTLVGRNIERVTLMEKLQALLRGETGGTVIIEGDAGIGKSRLVDDLIQQAWALNVRFLIGAGDAIEKSTPYHAWREIFSQLLGLGALVAPEARRAHVLTQLQASPGLLRLAPLLNAVLPLDLPENEATQHMDGEARANNTRDILIRLLQMGAGRAPTMLILEDAHWMDSASWWLAILVSQQVRPLFMVMATRPLAEEYRQMMMLATGMHWLRLEPLSPDHTLELVCQRLGVPALPEPAAALIREKAQGNPFFSEGLAYTLKDAGLIVVSGGQCRLAPDAGDLSAIKLPDTIQGLITSRIDPLTPGQQLTLKVASVIGRTFTLDILRDVYPIDSDKARLADHLAILQQADLIAPAPGQLDRKAASEAQAVYTFKNVATQEVAYNLMLFAQRRQLHRDIAEWHERRYAEDLPPYYSLLAYHWSKAVEGQQAEPALILKAIDYLEKAGEQALRNYANQEATRFFNEAIALSERAAAAGQRAAVDRRLANLRRARWERQLGEAYLSMGRPTESCEHLEQTVALLRQAVPGSRFGVWASLSRQILIQAAHRLWPGAALTAQSIDQSEKLEAARAYWTLGQVYFYANDTLRNINANLYSLNLAEQAGPSPELARSYASVCIAAGLLRLHRLAEIYSRWAGAAAQRAEHLPSLVWVLLMTAVYDAGVGHWESARDAVRQAIEISNRQGDQRRWEQSLNTLATITSLQGGFAGIAPLFANLCESARRRGDAQYQVYGWLGQAMCQLRMGQTDEALALLDKVETMLARKLGRLEETYAYGLLALARLRKGQLPLARQAADKVIELIGLSRPISYNLVFAYSGAAQTYLDLWETGSVLDFPGRRASPASPGSEIGTLKALAHQACQILHAFARVFPIGRPAAWICQGAYAWLSANPSQAWRAWRKGLAEAERLGMPYEQGWAHYELGRHAAGEERSRHLNQARQIFERLGAGYDLARVQAASAQETNHGAALET